MTDVSTSEPVHQEEPAKRKWSLAKEFSVLAAVALLLTLLVRTFVVQAFSIPSGSMENTLGVGDRVLVNKVVYRMRGIKRGEVVVFKGRDPWDSKEYIKRVIGLPGDRVACCDKQGRVTVNGTPLDERDYLYPGNAPSDRRFNVTVPEGRLWVMGDHRANSGDSRGYLGGPGGGTIGKDWVIGRAFVVVWPVSHWKSLPIPGTFERL